MKKKELTAKELEEQIKNKIEVDNKNAINALKAQQQEELKNLRAELAKKKRQEFAQMVDDVGKYFISKYDIDGRHNTDMTTEDYKTEIDKMIEFYQAHSSGEQEY